MNEENEEKEKKKIYRRVKNIHLVDKNKLYSFYELRQLLDYPSNAPLRYFVSLGLRVIECTHIHGEELIAFNNYLRAELSKHSPNQIWCTSCKDFKEVKNNEISVETDYSVQYKSGDYRLHITGICADCGTKINSFNCTSKLPELEKLFKINYIN